MRTPQPTWLPLAAGRVPYDQVAPADAAKMGRSGQPSRTAGPIPTGQAPTDLRSNVLSVESQLLLGQQALDLTCVSPRNSGAMSLGYYGQRIPFRSGAGILD